MYYNKSKGELVDVGTLYVVVELKQKIDFKPNQSVYGRVRKGKDKHTQKNVRRAQRM